MARWEKEREIGYVAIAGAIALTLAVIATVILLWHPGGELPTSNANVSQVPAPSIPLTRDVTQNNSPPPLEPKLAPIVPEQPANRGPSPAVPR